MVTLSPCSDLPKNKSQIMPLHNLPYDLLLNISQYLDLHDIHILQLVSPAFVSDGNLRAIAKDQLGFTRNTLGLSAP
jgi:hypothetical protein